MEFNLNNLLRWEKKHFIILGLYPIQTSNKLKRAWRNFKAAFCVSCVTILFLSMSFGLALEVTNVSEAAETLCMWMTFFAFLPKILSFIYNGRHLLQMEESLNYRILYKYYDIFGHDSVAPIMLNCTYMAWTYRIFCILYLLYVAIQPQLQPEAKLPFPGWMPFDQVRHRNAAYAVKLFCVSVSANVNSSLDIYPAFSMTLCVAQFRLLKTCLENIDYTRKPGPGKIGPEALKDLVLLYQHIIDYVEIVEKTFNLSIFVQFLCTIGVICFTGFRMLIIPPTEPDFILMLAYFGCMLSQILMYCWFGNEVQFESASIGASCYMSNWYEGTRADNKNLSIIMERSKRNVSLTAGKFFILSLPTLVMILRSSYSYFAVLRQYYKDKDFFKMEAESM